MVVLSCVKHVASSTVTCHVWLSHRLLHVFFLQWRNTLRFWYVLQIDMSLLTTKETESSFNTDGIEPAVLQIEQIQWNIFNVPNEENLLLWAYFCHRNISNNNGKCCSFKRTTSFRISWILAPCLNMLQQASINVFGHNGWPYSCIQRIICSYIPE